MDSIPSFPRVKDNNVSCTLILLFTTSLHNTHVMISDEKDNQIAVSGLHGAQCLTMGQWDGMPEGSERSRVAPAGGAVLVFGLEGHRAKTGVSVSVGAAVSI